MPFFLGTMHMEMPGIISRLEQMVKTVKIILVNVNLLLGEIERTKVIFTLGPTGKYDPYSLY